MPVFQGTDSGIAAQELDWEPWTEHCYNHSATWFLASELLKFNYEQAFENRRGDYNETLAEGKGERTTVRACLGKLYFEHLEILRSIGNPENVRIIISFDS